MHGLLMVLAVLSMPPPLLSTTPTADVEAGLLSALGLSGRPRHVDRRRAFIPPAMMALYRQQTGQDVVTTSLPLPGRLARSANTVRSFTHTGT